jgi:hypothetical protein
VIPFSPALPNITKSQPVRAFRVGQYLTLLFEKPQSLADAGGIGTGLISYLYALAVVTTTKPADLLLMVTSEQSGPELRRMAKEKTGIEQTTDPFLCVFDEKGAHHNLGHSPEWAIQERFVQRGLDVIREHFKISEAPAEVQTSASPASPPATSFISKWTSTQYLLASIAAAVAAMLIYPPYRVLGPQGVVQRTGYAFIFDLPHRASIDVGQLFMQWVGVLIVGAIAYVLLNKRS